MMHTSRTNVCLWLADRALSQKQGPVTDTYKRIRFYASCMHF